MAEKLMRCAACGTGLEQKSGAGRPAVYCSDACRRFSEFQIRALVRRIDKYQIELRELKAGSWHYSADERRERLTDVRGWVRKDTARLRVLLGGRQ
jgi:hypothetical protein